MERGEEVITRDDPRNILNGVRRGQGGGAPPQNIRAIFAVGESEIANAMASAPGEKVIMTTLQRNIASVKTMLR